MESKPHRVEVQDNTVTKHFGDPAMFSRELYAYELGLPMLPRLMSYTKPEKIVLEKIGGEPYLDRSFGPSEACRLAETLAAFHTATMNKGKCLCHWDNQPRNVINANNSFYLIDFAESRISFPEDDVSHLLLFWASEFTAERMKELAGAFIHSYTELLPLDHAKWRVSLERSILRFDERRTLHGRPGCHMDPRVASGNREFLSNLHLSQ